MTEQVVIGVDAGGTSTRCAVATLDGRVRATGRAGGANQFSSSDPSEAFEAALRSALETAGDVTVQGGVFGVAGASAAGHETAQRTVSQAWQALGLPGQPYVTDDVATAFASGSTATEGTVLGSGTGAFAAYVRGGEVVRRCDGYGWLLGDEGSAVWIALAALRSVLADIDGRGRSTRLRDRAAVALDIVPGDAQEIIRAVHQRSPAELGVLAPEVACAAAGGDSVASDIVAEAAGRLLTNIAVVAPEPMGASPVVCAGSLLAAGPVADQVRAGLWEHHEVVPRTASEGVLGAAGMALRAAGASPEAHTVLLDAAEQVPG